MSISNKFMISIIVLLLILLLSIEIQGENDAITYGSMVKLKNKGTGHHLHSHQITWGSGSQQQSVTGHGSHNDQGSNWLVKEPHKATDIKEVGVPVACGDKVRLEHVQTGKNLHSHLFKSALTRNQEVSGFGDNGRGDTGDDWEIVCEGQTKGYWNRGAVIELKHADTSKYLYTSTRAKFNQQNCGMQCPIAGQTEVSSAASRSEPGTTKWQTTQGLYFPSKTGVGGRDEGDDEL